METLPDRIAAIRAQIAAAAARSGRDPAAIQLIGVSKTHPAATVLAARAAGIDAFGENRVQEAEAKIAALAHQQPPPQWHLIGHLQRNKARRAAQIFDLIHSLDSLALAQSLDRHAAEAKRMLPVLLQVNVSGEASKDGFELANWQNDQQARDTFFALVEQILALPQIRVRGLMTIAPYTPDPAAARSVFASTRALRDALADRFADTAWHELSMGMSDDFAVAIEAGATMVRVGRALFGARG